MDKVNLELDLLRELVRDVPPDQREEAVAEAVQMFGQIFARYEAEPPTWLAAALGPPPGIEEVNDMEHYMWSVALSEAVRRATRKEVQKHPRGIKGLAGDVGLSLGVLRPFLGGALLNGKTWAALVDPRARTGGEMEPAPFELIGLGMLTESLPARVREQGRLFLAYSFADWLSAKGLAEPAWLTDETDWLSL